MKFCPKCQQNKSKVNFYHNPKTKDRLLGWCKECFDKKNDERRTLLKEKAILYKGGKCIRCPLTYPETPAYIFDFHHRDPKTKDKNWTSIRKHGWLKIQKEIDKCDLVCANCHRHIEYGASGGT